MNCRRSMWIACDPPVGVMPMQWRELRYFYLHLISSRELLSLLMEVILRKGDCAQVRQEYSGRAQASFDEIRRTGVRGLKDPGRENGIIFHFFLKQSLMPVAEDRKNFGATAELRIRITTDVDGEEPREVTTAANCDIRVT
jgi:hypothetical protein